MNSLPAINFTKANMSTSPDSISWLSTAKDVRDALEEYGCFIAITDEVSFPPELSEAIFRQLQHLFDLPNHIKSQNTCQAPYFAHNQPSTDYPLHEDLGLENVTNEEIIQRFSNLMWPLGNQSFWKTMKAYVKLASEMEKKVSRMVFESYNVEKYHDDHIASTTYLMRLAKYRAPGKGESDLGSPAHTDKSFLTILHQNQVNGLEVQTKDGQWFSVHFPPCSFVVMAGEAFLAWSNNRAHSCLHRVRMREQETRYSVILFSFKKGITKIPEELVDDDHPLQFAPFDNFALRHSYFTQKGEKTNNTVLWRLRGFRPCFNMQSILPMSVLIQMIN